VRSAAAFTYNAIPEMSWHAKVRQITLQFFALFEPAKEKGGFVVTFPDLDWGVTQGDTEQ